VIGPSSRPRFRAASAAVDGRTGAAGTAAAILPDDAGADLAAVVDAADLAARRVRGVEIAVGRDLPGDGPRGGGDRSQQALGLTPTHSP
jgi:hypothetical protein